MRAERRGSVQISVDTVVQRGHVGRALDRGMAAQRHHAGARSSNGGPARLAIRSFVAGPGPFGPRLYAQLALSYAPRLPFSGQKSGSLNPLRPENTPSRSSVSLKSSLMIVAAFV